MLDSREKALMKDGNDGLSEIDHLLCKEKGRWEGLRRQPSWPS